ncbi:MAG: signal recognition particle receptor subunit alpha, partial [Clostridia bacterium]|nr:signal recognition particle receptor subunit alpha [Clostridia bacterium]
MFFKRIKESFGNKISSIFGSNKELEEILEEIEETLVCSDIGIETAMEICDNLRKKSKSENKKDGEALKNMLKEELIQMVKKPEVGEKNIEFDKKCILVVGVNGVGKTTSIAKLTGMYKKE